MRRKKENRQRDAKQMREREMMRSLLTNLHENDLQDNVTTASGKNVKYILQAFFADSPADAMPDVHLCVFSHG